MAMPHVKWTTLREALAIVICKNTCGATNHPCECIDGRTECADMLQAADAVIAALEEADLLKMVKSSGD